MRSYSLRHLADSTLRHDLKALVTRQRGLTAAVLAHIAEFDDRTLYAEDGYSSMYAYCVGELGFSEDAACKHITAARAARRFPAIFAMIEDGRQHLTGLVTLAPHLVEANADDLLAASAGKTRKAIELLLAERFPRPDVPTLLEPLASPAAAVTSGNLSAPGRITTPFDLPTPLIPGFSTLFGVTADETPGRITPLAPQRFGLQTTIDQETSDLLREAQELLGLMGSSHVADVLKNAMRLYVEKLRRQKFGATDAPRRGREPDPDSRHIPNEVKRAVWVRDGGQCAFASEDGHRCDERSGLEFDHMIPYSRGGDSSVSNVRLLCPAHNQLEAERTYGAEFMARKREVRRGAA